MKKTYLVVGALFVGLCAQNGFASKRGGAEKGRMSSSSRHFQLNDVLDSLSSFKERSKQYSDAEWNFVLGYAEFKHKKFKDAAELFEKLGADLPIISDHIIYYRAAAAVENGENEEALEFLDALKVSDPESIFSNEARLVRARALIALGRGREAIAALRSYKEKANDGKDFEADLLIAKAMMEDGDDSVVDFVKSLAITADGEAALNKLSPLIEDIKRKFRVDIMDWLNEPPQQYRLAESFAECSQWDDAGARLEKIIKGKKLDGALLTQAKWLRAKSLRWVHRYDEAIGLMEELENDPNVAGYRDDVLSTLATTYTKKNDYDKAIALRNRMMKMYPSTANQMVYKIAFLYMDEGKYREAIKYWQRAIAGLFGEKREQAEWYLAWCHHMAGMDEDAVAIMERMREARGKKSGIADRLAYWRARLLEKLGSKNEAHAAFRMLISERPNGYYGELSRRRIAGDSRDVANFTDAKWRGGSSSKSDKVQPGKSPHVARAIFLGKLNLKEEAGREVRAAIAAKEIGEGLNTIRLAEENYVHDIPYRVAESRYRDILKRLPDEGGADRFLWEMAYPRAYDSFIARLTKGSAIDSRLVWSIMRNESAFRPEVSSPVGAVGLMQLMPTTANTLARENGKEGADRADLYNPAVNATFGVVYLKKLSKLFPNNPVAWIASYNAGEEAVSRWIKNGSLNDIEEWIEEIPYSETNLYVKKVLVSYWNYQRLYKN